MKVTIRRWIWISISRAIYLYRDFFDVLNRLPGQVVAFSLFFSHGISWMTVGFSVSLFVYYNSMDILLRCLSFFRNAFGDYLEFAAAQKRGDYSRINTNEFMSKMGLSHRSFKDGVWYNDFYKMMFLKIRGGLKVYESNPQNSVIDMVTFATPLGHRIFLPDKLEDMTEFQKFLVLHELGHVAITSTYKVTESNISTVMLMVIKLLPLVFLVSIEFTAFLAFFLYAFAWWLECDGYVKERKKRLLVSEMEADRFAIYNASPSIIDSINSKEIVERITSNRELSDEQILIRRRYFIDCLIRCSRDQKSGLVNLAVPNKSKWRSWKYLFFVFPGSFFLAGLVFYAQPPYFLVFIVMLAVALVVFIVAFWVILMTLIILMTLDFKYDERDLGIRGLDLIRPCVEGVMNKNDRTCILMQRVFLKYMEEYYSQEFKKRDVLKIRDSLLGHKPIFKPDELDLFVNRKNHEAYIFYGKEIDIEDFKMLEIDRSLYTAKVLTISGVKLELGVLVSPIILASLDFAKEMFFNRTRDGEVIESKTVPLRFN